MAKQHNVHVSMVSKAKLIPEYQSLEHRSHQLLVLHNIYNIIIRYGY